MTIVSRIWRRINSILYRYFVNRIIIYDIYSATPSCALNKYPIKKAQLLEEICEINLSDEFRQTAKERFQQGCSLFYIAKDDSELMAWGWVARRIKKFYVYEIAREIVFKEPVEILFDFYTKKEFRNKGAYKNLLSKMIGDKNGCNRKVIYALSYNKPSRRSIEHVGFQPCGKLSHFSGTMNA